MHDWYDGTPDERLPVSLLTGFLGSGKTTVLNHLLSRPSLSDAVVIINEFGAIGLDHDLVEATTEDMVLLQSGCLCCTIRGDLVETLRTLMDRRARGAVTAFGRVLIETTGLADPAPILHTLMTDRFVASQFRLDGVITTVDAVNGASTLDRHAEAVKQVAVADRLLLTKLDMVDGDAVRGMERRLKALNPAAPVLRTLQGAVDPLLLLEAGLYDPKTKSPDVERWLNAEAFGHGHHHHDGHHHDSHTHDHAHAAGHGHDVNRHDDHIHAVCLTLDEPVAADAIGVWLEALLLLKGPDLLRVKGILNVADLPGPIVIHGVQHIFHPPQMLKRWPSADRRTRIVFITRDLDEGMLRDSLSYFTRDPADEPHLSPIDAGGGIAMFEVRPPA